MTCKTCFGHPGCLAQTDGKNDSVDAQARELILPFPEIVLMPRRVGVFGGICNCPVGLILEHRQFTDANVAAELAYAARPESRGFERPYGWAWLLKLAAELKTWDDPRARAWSRSLQPLADAVAQALASYLPRLDYPIRVGTHANTAFSLSLALGWLSAFSEK